MDNQSTMEERLDHFYVDFWGRKGSKSSPGPVDLAPFIKQERKAAYAQGRVDEAKTCKGCEEGNLPINVTKWKDHGKKHGYWKFFEEETREAAIKECKVLVYSNLNSLLNKL